MSVKMVVKCTFPIKRYKGKLSSGRQPLITIRSFLMALLFRDKNETRIQYKSREKEREEKKKKKN